MLNFALVMLCLVLAACGRDASSEGNSARPQRPAPVSPTAVTDALKPAAALTAASKSGDTATVRFDRTIAAPTDLDIVFILYDHLRQIPPFEAWANQDSNVNSANEFERDQKRQARIKELQAQFAAVQGLVQSRSRYPVRLVLMMPRTKSIPWAFLVVGVS
jgi:hypothetical protein